MPQDPHAQTEARTGRQRGSPVPRRGAGAARLLALVLILLSLRAGREADARAGARPGPAPGHTARFAQTQPTRMTVRSVSSLGEARIPAGGTVLGTPLGGLSGLTYDAAEDAYFAISDDRGTRAPARFYRLTIALQDGALRPEGIAFTEVITITDREGRAFDPGSIDPEGIAASPAGGFYISSEGDSAARPPVDPFVAELDAGGREIGRLPLPTYFLPNPEGTQGVRANLALEPLALAAGPGEGRLLLTGTENALAQDGPVAGPDSESPARILAWDLLSPRRPAWERVYPVAPIPAASQPPGGFADNGLVELAPLDEAGTLLTMERSYAAGVGNTVRLFEVRPEGASDVADLPALVDPGTGQPVAYRPVAKRQLADIAALGPRPDNLEGMAFGPDLADGRRLLILVSDDNFSPSQVTQLLALALEVAPAPPELRIHLPLALRGAPAGGP